MIKRRDEDVYNFLQDFHHATTSHIQSVFFPKSIRYCQIRLKYLVKSGYIKREKNTIGNGFAYYIDKKSILPQVHHDLIRTELFVNMNKRYKITTWSNETTIGNVRPDAVAIIEDHGISFPVFAEIHLNNQFDFDKYKELIKAVDLKTVFGLMPRVIICTDRSVKLPLLPIKFKLVGLDMSGLDTLLK